MILRWAGSHTGHIVKENTLCNRDVVILPSIILPVNVKLGLQGHSGPLRQSEWQRFQASFCQRG